MNIPVLAQDIEHSGRSSRRSLSNTSSRHSDGGNGGG